MLSLYLFVSCTHAVEECCHRDCCSGVYSNSCCCCCSYSYCCCCCCVCFGRFSWCPQQRLLLLLAFPFASACAPFSVAALLLPHLPLLHYQRSGDLLLRLLLAVFINLHKNILIAMPRSFSLFYTLSTAMSCRRRVASSARPLATFHAPPGPLVQRLDHCG